MENSKHIESIISDRIKLIREVAKLKLENEQLRKDLNEFKEALVESSYTDEDWSM